jgi:hypothetical protein
VAERFKNREEPARDRNPMLSITFHPRRSEARDRLFNA